MAITATYVDSSSFIVSGDKTNEFVEGRRVKADCGTDGNVYSEVTSASYDSSPDETTVTLDDSVLTDNLVEVWYGVVAPGAEGALPVHNHATDAQGGVLKQVLKPSVESPSDGATDIGETPDITLSTYYSLYSRDQKAIRVQVSDTSGDFSSPVFDKTVEEATDTVQVESDNLNEDTTYYCRGQYQNNGDYWSEWSDENSFTTAESFDPMKYIASGPGPTEGIYDSTTDTGYYGYVGCGNEPIYSSGDSYDKGDIVNDGNDEFFYSKTDSNSGNSLPSAGGENTDWKWIGNGILTDGPTVSSEIGLSAGTAFNDDCGWLKFLIGKDAADPMSTRHGTVTAKDRVVFISRKTIRNDLSWDNIYDAGAVYGTGDAGTANSGSDTTQDAQITVDGNDYIVRLMTGCQGDPASEGYNNQSCSDDEGGGSEWNDLFYRVHEDEPTCDDPTVGMPGGNEDDKHGGPQDGDNWANFTNVDLQVYSSEAGDGTNSWCQEQGDDTSRRVSRGINGVANFYAYASGRTYTSDGWRPCLELIQP